MAKDSIKTYVYEAGYAKIYPFDELTKDSLRHTLNVYDIQYNREDINRLFEAFLI